MQTKSSSHLQTNLLTGIQSVGLSSTDFSLCSQVPNDSIKELLQTKSSSLASRRQTYLLDLAVGWLFASDSDQPNAKFDHWSRDKDEFFRIVKYIENNPVKAGLVKKLEDWPWSSASERKRRGWSEFKALT